MMGSTLSYAIRRELAFTDTQFLAGNAQLYNVTVTSHALIMIFFYRYANFNWRFRKSFYTAFRRSPRSCLSEAKQSKFLITPSRVVFLGSFKLS